MKPTLLITRPLPESVVDAARRHFDVTLRSATTPLSAADLRAALREYDAVLPTLGDRFDMGVFADVPNPRAKILANFGVGYNTLTPPPPKRQGSSFVTPPVP